MSEFFAHPIAVFALLGLFALLLFGMFISRKKLSARQLVYTALLLALTVLLHQIRLFHMPQGGSVTLGAMVPLLLLSYRYGAGAGALAGFLYGCINLLQDPFLLHPAQVLFDYPLPYIAMGAAGAFPRHLMLGTGLAFFLRFLCHFISGFVFFGSYAPAGESPVLYSLVFNASYLVPEYIITCIILKFLPLHRLLDAMQDGR